jgi:hypothetical protein
MWLGFDAYRSFVFGFPILFRFDCPRTESPIPDEAYFLVTLSNTRISGERIKPKFRS